MSTNNVDAVWLNPRGPGAYGASLAASAPTIRQQWTFALVCATILAAFAVAMVLRNAAAPQLGLTPLLVGGQLMTAYLLCVQMIQLRRLNVGILALAFLFTMACYNIAPALFAPFLLTPEQWIAFHAHVRFIAHAGFGSAVVLFVLLRSRLRMARGGRRRLLTVAFVLPFLATALSLLFLAAISGVTIAQLSNPFVAVIPPLITALGLAGYVFRTRLRSIAQMWVSVAVLGGLLDALALYLSALHSFGEMSSQIFGLAACVAVPLAYIVEFNWMYERLLTITGILHHEAFFDDLTQVGNRRFFDRFGTAEWRRGIREQTPMALLMVDVDHFKLFNDCFGHVAGDQCLKDVASCMARVLQRPGDAICRYGGEEFAVILPGTDLGGALGVAERLLRAVAALKIRHPLGIDEMLSVSIGVASMRPQRDSAFEELVSAADGALYVSKGAGRNRVTVAPLAATAAPRPAS